MPTYTHIGGDSFATNDGGVWSPAAVGNLLVLSIRCNDTLSVCTSATSGSNTFRKVYETNTSRPSSAQKYVCFLIAYVSDASASQAVVALGNSNFNVSNIEVCIDEYSSSFGKASTWNCDVAAFAAPSETEGTVSPFSYPTLRPSQDGIYHGYGIPNGNPGAGSTPGFSYEITVARGNIIAYNPTATVAGGALTPQATDGSPDWCAIAMLVYAATGPATGTSFRQVGPHPGQVLN